jgi:hydroxymethylpyrimidine pyrophosphatase-like HAD family hydrolase
MKYLALACDFDGTLAWNEVVDDSTLAALDAFRASGRKLLMVTGRELNDLRRVFNRWEFFELIVAENGALIHRPATGETRRLAKPPPPEFAEYLRSKGAQPLSIGEVVVATREPYETLALQAIHDLRLELQVIFNKGAVMILPTGINKATGLKKALKELGLFPEQVAAVGDAENDHALLDLCGFSVAVSNAVPALKDHADWVTAGARGAGVVEIIQKLLTEDKPEPQPVSNPETLAAG